MRRALPQTSVFWTFPSDLGHFCSMSLDLHFSVVWISIDSAVVRLVSIGVIAGSATWIALIVTWKSLLRLFHRARCPLHWPSVWPLPFRYLSTFVVDRLSDRTSSLNLANDPIVLIDSSYVDLVYWENEATETFNIQYKTEYLLRASNKKYWVRLSAARNVVRIQNNIALLRSRSWMNRKKNGVCDASSIPFYWSLLCVHWEQSWRRNECTHNTDYANQNAARALPNTAFHLPSSQDWAKHTWPQICILSTCFRYETWPCATERRQPFCPPHNHITIDRHTEHIIRIRCTLHKAIAYAYAL